MIVIIAAVFTYNLVVHTKAMEVIKSMLISVSDDKRILVLILAWGFGGFFRSCGRLWNSRCYSSWNNGSLRI